MGGRRGACLLGLSCLLAAVPACQALSRSRPVPVLVRDAETKQPIAGAEVRLTYPAGDSLLAPSRSVEAAGADGVARLRAAPWGDIGVLVDVSAPGRLAEQRGLSVEEVRAIEPAGFFEAVDHRPARLVVELYAGPPPTVDLVLPPGFRGVVKADVQPRDDPPCPRGQRCFRYDVPPSGEVTVAGPALLRHAVSPDFRLLYADGAPLARHGEGAEVGYWWLRTEGERQCFLVGTRADYDAARPADGGGDRGERRSSGGKGGGGRGRHGRGGQPQADTSSADTGA
jgi:hypothetical protein